MNYYDILLAKKLNSGGGSSVEVEPLSVTENGTYTAEQNKAFSPVTVNVSGGGGSLTKLYTVTMKNIHDRYPMTIDMNLSADEGAPSGETMVGLWQEMIEQLPVYIPSYGDAFILEPQETRTVNILGIIGKEGSFTIFEKAVPQPQISGECRLEYDTEKNRWVVYTFGDCEIKVTALD